MRIKKFETNGEITGYRMSLSARETYAWANKPGSVWPCSEISNRRLSVEIDRNGLYCVHPSNIGYSAELEAIVADHIPDEVKHLWPTWLVAPAV
jgi:hypothetical protein